MGDLGQIGLVAVRRELQPLLEIVECQGREQHAGMIFRTGLVGRQPVALAEVLIGPVNAALGAQALVLRYAVDGLVSFGSAGALEHQLSTGDLVIASRTMAHDAGFFLGHVFDPSGVMGRDPKGRIGYRRAFEADPDWVLWAQSTAHQIGVQTLRVGTVVTGNQAIFSTARTRWLRRTFDALAVDMESAAVAHVAVAYRLPWLAVRAISDMAREEGRLDFGRLRTYLDAGQPAWQQRWRQMSYLLAHPTAWRRLRRLERGQELASRQASRLVGAMLRS
jgi:5'-methylthioadenosine/S-adenosylhomocysteine nucleosidase